MDVPMARAVPAAVVATMAVRVVDVPMSPTMPAPPAPAHLMLVSPLALESLSDMDLISKIHVRSVSPAAVSPMVSVAFAVAVVPPPAPASKTPVAPLVGPASPTAPADSIAPSAPTLIPSSSDAMARDEKR